jgi:hypothetical protein
LPDGIGEMSVKRDSKCHFSQIQSIHHISCSPMAKCWLFLLMCLLPLQALAAFSGAANTQPVAGLAAHAGMAHCHADSNSMPAADSDCGGPGQAPAGCDHCHSCQLCAAPLLPLQQARSPQLPGTSVRAQPPTLNFSSLAPAPVYHPPR